MNLRDLPSEIQKLSTLEYTSGLEGWPDYQKLGIGPQHIPALIEISRSAPDFWREEASDGEFNLPLHAWRALTQMRAPQALPELIEALRWVDDNRNDLMILDEFPEIFSRFEPASASPLVAYLIDPQNEPSARLCVAEGLVKIASDHAEFREEAIRALSTVLERYTEEEKTFNGFIISHLADLDAVEAAPLVEKAYQANRVDLSIQGDWEDFQVQVGLTEKRQSRRPSYMPFTHVSESGLTDGDLNLTTPYPDFGEPDLQEQKWQQMASKAEKKDKQKRKEAKTTRKKNRKKKK